MWNVLDNDSDSKYYDILFILYTCSLTVFYIFHLLPYLPHLALVSMTGNQCVPLCRWQTQTEQGTL